MSKQRLSKIKPGVVAAVARSDSHTFSKNRCLQLQLITGQGVSGDAHCGELVKHRSRVKTNPNQPNQRQVHLIAIELLQQLEQQGYQVAPGNLGENITTAGIDLLALPQGSRLTIGSAVVLVVTGLRNPCWQINAFKPGLINQVLERHPDGRVVRKAGIMSVVERGGEITVGDEIFIELPAGKFTELEVV